MASRDGARPSRRADGGGHVPPDHLARGGPLPRAGYPALGAGVRGRPRGGRRGHRGAQGRAAVDVRLPLAGAGGRVHAGRRARRRDRGADRKSPPGAAVALTAVPDALGHAPEPRPRERLPPARRRWAAHRARPARRHRDVDAPRDAGDPGSRNARRIRVPSSSAIRPGTSATNASRRRSGRPSSTATCCPVSPSSTTVRRPRSARRFPATPPPRGGSAGRPTPQRARSAQA